MQEFNVTLIASPGTGGLVTGGGTFAAGGSRSVKAISAAGFEFLDWSGSISAPTPALTFVLQSNMFLQANFIPNPFAPFKGNYAGLFSGTNGVALTNSGLFTATVTDKGNFSSKLQLAGQSYLLSGHFSLHGFSSSIPRKGLSPLSILLQLDLSGSNTITGQVSDGIWTADLLANRAVYSRKAPAPQAGRKYTLAIAGSDDASLQPGGLGFGRASVNSLGALTFSGELGDGTAVYQSSFVSGQGQWPLYLSLYSGKGVMLGWLTFTNEVDRDVTGQVNWMKAPQRSKLYAGGFAGEPPLEVVGSVYAFTNRVPLLGINQGEVILKSGNLWQSITNQIQFATNKIINLGPSNRLSLAITASSGLFRGSVMPQAPGKPVPFSGILLQKPNAGYGHFLGTNQSGSVYLGPE